MLNQKNIFDRSRVVEYEVYFVEMYGPIVVGCLKGRFCISPPLCLIVFPITLNNGGRMLRQEIEYL